METIAETVLFLSLALLGYAYLGYPVALLLLSVFRPDPRPAQDDPDVPDDPDRWPEVTVVVSAYNEEAVIARRIENLLDLDYPPHRFKILIGSDGSTDRTSEIVGLYRTSRVVLHDFALQRGKANVLNDLVSRATGEYVVFTDANTFFQEDALKELIRGFRQNPSACAVVGRLEFHTAEGTVNPDGLYWRYETLLKTLESRFGSVLGANGAIYAIRRRRFCPLPPDTIVDDFLIPMLMRQNRGGWVLFRPSARAWEPVPEQVRDEFRRRVRIGAGDAHALRHTWRLLFPRHGMLAVSYWSHKVLRWMSPWLLIAAFAFNLPLLDRPWGRTLFAAQAACYALGLVAPLLGNRSLLGRAATAAGYFIAINTALLIGSLQYLFGRAKPTWRRTPRTADVTMAGPALARRRTGAGEAQADRPAA